jgi:uncharacterized protein (TIGR02246 family)
MRPFVLLSILAWTVLLGGCASPPAPPPPPVRNLAAEVAAEFDKSVAGWNVGNLNAFLSIYADDATFAMADGYLHGRAAIHDYYAPLFARGATRDALEIEQLDVEVLSPDLVLVRGIYSNNRNHETTRRGTTSLILRYSLGHWRVIHDHST